MIIADNTWQAVTVALWMCRLCEFTKLLKLAAEISSTIVQCGMCYSNVLCVHWQALFRKIAAALPGMESLSTQKQEDLVDVNLTSNSAQNKGAGPTGAVSGCQCWRVQPVT